MRRFTTVALICALSALAPIAHAQTVVYDNGAPPRLDEGDNVKGFVSDPSYPFISRNLRADDFTLSAFTTFNSVQWFGEYASTTFPLSKQPAPVDQFTISFFGVTNGIPNTSALPALSFTVGNDNNRTPIFAGTAIPPTIQYYSYTSSLGTSVTLPAGTYAISIVNDTSPYVNKWYWTGTKASGSHFMRASPTSAFISDTGSTSQYNLTFRLQVTAAPEPGSLSLLGVGLVGGAGLARRRKTRRVEELIFG